MDWRASAVERSISNILDGRIVWTPLDRAVQVCLVHLEFVERCSWALVMSLVGRMGFVKWLLVWTMCFGAWFWIGWVAAPSCSNVGHRCGWWLAPSLQRLSALGWSWDIWYGVRQLLRMRWPHGSAFGASWIGVVIPRRGDILVHLMSGECMVVGQCWCIC